MTVEAAAVVIALGRWLTSATAWKGARLCAREVC